MHVTFADDSSQPAWDGFLARQPQYHHALSWKWRSIIPKIFGHEPKYLLATDDSEKVIGILPLFFIKSLLFGRSLVSVPYLNAGGILADSREASDALLERVAALGAELRADYCELRHVIAAPFYPSELPLKTHKMTMHLPLSTNPEDLFSSFRPKLRSQVRRPSKDGIYAHVSGINLDEGASLQAFYSVFSEHMRDLGTPVYPRNLFFEVKKSFGTACRIITVWQSNSPIAAGITVGEGKIAEIPWASALKRYSKKAPNMLLYWEAIKTACLDGYSLFDFGRSSPESGAYRFKEQWGAQPVPLHWYYQLYRGELPDVNPQNPKYRALVGCWKHLPMPVANLLGPWLTRSIP